MRVLRDLGSLRRDSHNTRLLRAAAGPRRHLAELELFEGRKDVPPTTRDDDGDLAPKARRLREAIARPTRS
jgi:chromate reductase